MAFSKDYYTSKQEAIIEQVNKLLQKNTQAQYDFVKEHSELVQKYNEIAGIIKQEETKKTPEGAEPAKPAKSKK